MHFSETKKSVKLIYTLATSSLLLASLLFSGCTSPTMLGLNKTQWNQLSPDQKKIFVKHYHSIQSHLITSSKPSTQAASENNAVTNITEISLPDIDVTILSGQASFSPDFLLSPITPLHMHLKYGLCQSALLLSQSQKQSSKLWFCYTQKMMGIDPSFYDMNQAWGTAFIDANPLWNRGFTYQNINTTGYARLSHAFIQIQSTSPILIAPPASDIAQPIDVDTSKEQTHG